MSYLPWYVGGVGIAAVMVAHWLSLRRMMAVSGRYTALVNRLRFGPPKDEGQDLSAEELIRAMREATEAAFGASAMDLPEPESSRPPVSIRSVDRDNVPQTPGTHLLFLGALVVGGLLSALLGGGLGVTSSLHGELFARVAQGSPLGKAALLLGGGVLVGAGTRMAGGCTSGHGLCGVSRSQKGSLLSTLGFFGAGVATSLLLGRFL